MSTSAVTINLNARFDPKPFKDAENAVDSLGKKAQQQGRESLFRPNRAEAQGLLNLSRQASDVFTQGITGTSPFTILIQQGPQVLDILATGALSAGKFAAALGGMGAVAGVGFLIADSFMEAQKAIEDAADAAKRLKESNMSPLETIEKKGVLPGDEERARKLLINTLATTTGPGYEAIKKRVNKQLDRIRSGEAQAQAESRVFSERISGPAARSLEDAAFRNELKQYNHSQLPELRKQLEDIQKDQERLAGMGKTRETAFYGELNATRESKLTKLIQALEAIAKAEEEWTRAYLEASEEVKVDEPKAKKKEEEKEVRNPSFSQEIVSTRQRIGGMANAPIFSDFRKQVEYLRFIAETSKQIAQNTARNAPTPSVVGGVSIPF